MGDIARTQIEWENLQQSLASHRSDIEAARHRMFQSKREAAEHRAKLAMHRETHAQEIGDLWQRLDIKGTALAPPLVEGGARKASELDDKLPSLVSAREEVEMLVRTERTLHQKETDLLSEELRAVRVELRDREQRNMGAVASALMALQAGGEKGNFDLSDADRRLLRQCAELRGPASRFMLMFGQSELPPLPETKLLDQNSHAEWLQSFSFHLSNLHQQLQALMREGQL